MHINAHSLKIFIFLHLTFKLFSQYVLKSNGSFSSSKLSNVDCTYDVLSSIVPDLISREFLASVIFYIPYESLHDFHIFCRLLPILKTYNFCVFKFYVSFLYDFHEIRYDFLRLLRNNKKFIYDLVWLQKNHI